MNIGLRYCLPKKQVLQTNGITKDIALMQILAKKQSDVHNGQNERFASPTPTLRVSSSIKQGPAQLFARLNSAKANRPPQNQNAEITTITQLPQSGTINYNSAYNTHPARIPSATQRPLSSIASAGFRTGSGRLLSNRPPSAQASSVPKLPQMSKY